MLFLYHWAPLMLLERYKPSTEQDSVEQRLTETKGHPGDPLSTQPSQINLVFSDCCLQTPLYVVSARSHEPARLRAGLLGASKWEKRAEAVTPGVSNPKGWQILRNSQIPQVSGENSCLDGLNVLERQVFESGERVIFPSFNG